MNVLILGSGGREHAFAWKISQSSLIHDIFIAPGNAGTEAFGTNLSIDPSDFKSIKKAVIEHGIKMVIETIILKNENGSTSKNIINRYSCIQ